MKGETIWITGASSGIGLELAKRLCIDNTVIISGRNQEKLDSICQQYNNMEFVAFDVSDAQNISRVTKELNKLAPHLDRVILNAGSCEYFDIDTPDWEIMERMMQINFLGMVNSFAACFELLKQAKRPHLIGISSQATAAPFTQAEGYGASKAAVDYWLNSLRVDIARFNIDVSTISPGFVDTPLTQKNEFPMPFLMTVEKAAERILSAIELRTFSCAFPKRLTALLMFSNWLSKRLPKKWQAIQNIK